MNMLFERKRNLIIHGRCLENSVDHAFVSKNQTRAHLVIHKTVVVSASHPDVPSSPVNARQACLYLVQALRLKEKDN